MPGETDRVIALQEGHWPGRAGAWSPERNDMVQYFAEQLYGFTVTEQGGVQSYGSRYVRPPILHGTCVGPRDDRGLRRRRVADGQADEGQADRAGDHAGLVVRPGWPPLGDTAAGPVGAARQGHRPGGRWDLRHPGGDPALRELLSLRHADGEAYLDSATWAFRLASSGAVDATQIHPHVLQRVWGRSSARSRPWTWT